MSIEIHSSHFWITYFQVLDVSVGFLILQFSLSIVYIFECLFCVTCNYLTPEIVKDIKIHRINFSSSRLALQNHKYLFFWRKQFLHFDETESKQRQVNQSHLFSPYWGQIFWNPAGVGIWKHLQKGPWLGKEEKQWTDSLIKQIAQKDTWRWNLENVEKLNQLTLLSKQQRAFTKC